MWPLWHSYSGHWLKCWQQFWWWKLLHVWLLTSGLTDSGLKLEFLPSGKKMISIPSVPWVSALTLLQTSFQLFWRFGFNLVYQQAHSSPWVTLLHGVHYTQEFSIKITKCTGLDFEPFSQLKGIFGNLQKWTTTLSNTLQVKLSKTSCPVGSLIRIVY